MTPGRLRWLARRVAGAYRRGGVTEVVRAVVRRVRVGRLDRMSREEEYRVWRSRHIRRRSTPQRSSRRFLVLAFGGGHLEATRESVDRAGASADVLSVAGGDSLPDADGHDYVTAVSAGDLLVPGALDELAAAGEQERRAVVFADEDLTGPEGSRHTPFLKPAWSPLLSLTLPGLYPGAPLAVSASLWDEARTGEGGALWAEAALRAADAAEQVIHLPLPLLSRVRRDGDDPLLGTLPQRRDLAGRAAARRGWRGRMVTGPRPETFRFLPEEGASLPRVSVIVPTRDQPDLFIPLARHLEERARALPLELIFVDHMTVDPRARECLDGIRSREAGRVLAVDGEFNYAAMINRGVRESTGDLLLLLNNDVEPIAGDWIEVLAHAALQHGVGASGALLLYPDRTIQHGAVALGIGTVAGHLHKYGGVRTDLPWVPADVAREVSAVTAACIMVTRSAFESVGGMDERELAVSYNDVDLCLKLTAAGHRIVYEPHAELIHHETVSRPHEVDPREVRAMRRRWSRRLEGDPYCPPGLHRLAELPHLDLWSGCDLSPRITDGAGRLRLR